MRINKKLIQPLVHEASSKDSAGTWHTKEFVDVIYIGWGLAQLVIIIFVSFMVISLSVPVVRHLWKKPGPPPKVITKIVKQSPFSAAQAAYIKQCERNTSNDGDTYKQGVPDVHTSDWTCKIPD